MNQLSPTLSYPTQAETDASAPAESDASAPTARDYIEASAMTAIVAILMWNYLVGFA